jgi:hypothetical protein
LSVKEDLLLADFSQCFEQMRHYDNGFKSQVQFGFASVSAIVAAAAALVANYGFTPQVLGVAAVLLLFSAVAALALPVGLARNRLYFAKVARYVNCMRSFFLTDADFVDTSGMYRDPTEPKLLNLFSGQTFQIFLSCASVSAVFTAGIACGIAASEADSAGNMHIPWNRAITLGLLSVAVQFGAILCYWRHHDRQTERGDK